MALCTPSGIGVNLWDESPLYMNPVPSFYDGSESTSRRQAPSPSYGVSRGHHREVVSEGLEENCWVVIDGSHSNDEPVGQT